MELLMPMGDETVQASSSLVDEVVEDLLERAGGSRDLSGLAVVFPGRRPGLYLRKKLADRLEAPYLPPEIYDIDGFMQRLAMSHPDGKGRMELEQEQLIYMLYGIVREVLDKTGSSLPMCDGFDKFYFWGHQLLEVLDEFGVELVSGRHLSATVPEALLDAGLTEEASGIWSLLPEIYKAWKKGLCEGRVWSRGEIYRLAAQVVEGEVEVPSFILLCGFFAPNKAEQVVFHALRTRGVLKVVNQSGEWSPGDEGPGPRLFLHKSYDLHSQVKRAREILLAQGPLQSPAGPEEIAVVLPRPEPLVPVLNWVLEDLSVPFNISMGYPLDRTPVSNLVEYIFRAQEGKDGARYYLDHYMAVISHPFIKGLNTDEPVEDREEAPFRFLVHRLSSHLQQRRDRFASLDEVMEVARSMDGVRPQALETLRSVHERAFEVFEGVCQVGEVADSLAGLLVFLIKEGAAGRHPLSSEFVGTILHLLERLSSGPVAREAGSPSGLFAMFRHLIRQTRIPFHGSPLEGLQLLGFLETRCLRFRKILVLDVEEGILPPERKPDPLLPPGLRKALGLPDPRRAVEISRYHLHRLLAGAREVHLLFTEGEGRSRSRFVEELIWTLEKHRGMPGAVEIQTVQAAAHPEPLQFREIPKRPEVLTLLQNRSFSPTSLDTYLHCPYRFYLRYVLDLEPEGRATADQVDGLMVGKVVHETLRRLYEPFLNREITIDGEVTSRLGSVLEAVLAEETGQFQGLRGGIRLLYEIIQLRLGHFLKMEQEYPGRRLFALELLCRASISLSDGRTVRLEGRLDRVDQLNDRRFMVIDYKTGTDPKVPDLNQPQPDFQRRELKARIRSLQLPLYIYLLRSHLGPAHYTWENFASCLYALRGLTTGSSRKNLERSFPKAGMLTADLMEEIYLPVIKGLLAEILDPDVPFEADASTPSYCRGCPFQGGLCRA